MKRNDPVPVITSHLDDVQRESWLSALLTSSKVIPAGCWERRGGAAYTTIEFEGRWVPSHRLACALVHGDVEAEEVVRHTCHNKSCVNPDHLRKGSHADNRHDDKSKGAGVGTLVQARMPAPTKRALEKRAASRGVSAGHMMVELLLALKEGRAALPKKEKKKSAVLSFRMRPELAEWLAGFCEENKTNASAVIRSMAGAMEAGTIDIEGSFLPNPFPADEED